MAIYAKARFRAFLKRDGKRPQDALLHVAATPVAFNNLSESELAADHWIEIVEPPKAEPPRAEKRRKPKRKPSPSLLIDILDGGAGD